MSPSVLVASGGVQLWGKQGSGVLLQCINCEFVGAGV